MAVFEARDLGKMFAGPHPYVALQHVNLQIDEGEFLCILGPSGCGKSTLLNLLAGFEQPSSGTLLFCDAPVRGPGRERVMFFQDSMAALLPWLSVQRNAELGLRLQGHDVAEQKRRARECLQLVGLLPHSHKFPNEVSGGMRQRLQIARALAVDPDVFLMDEPFAALDAMTRLRMHGALLSVWQKTRKTVVFVTHDVIESIILADRIAIMNVGPASRIQQVIKVNLPRPRDPANPQFGQLFKMVERELHLSESFEEESTESGTI